MTVQIARQDAPQSFEDDRRKFADAREGGGTAERGYVASKPGVVKADASSLALIYPRWTGGQFAVFTVAVSL